jgi:hypothetical protein
MIVIDRIRAFIKLGEELQNFDFEEKEELSWKAGNNNSWFSPQSIESALAGIVIMLEAENLKSWVEKYDLAEVIAPKNVGILLAGNIPGVGFHDVMCVLLSGHRAVLKLSSTDSVIMNFLIDRLIKIQPEFGDFIIIEDMLKGKDAYIATGSDNSSRYFNYYFGKYPHIIRKNRTSIAILDGSESVEDYLNLGKDIFQYFGLGCRNVSKIYIKSVRQLQDLLGALEVYSDIGNHHKYHNNYDYNKSIHLVNGDKHLDNGFLILKESEELVSPIAVLFYEVYNSPEHLKELIAKNEDKIQCIVGHNKLLPDIIPFGLAQYPTVDEYADRVDTMSFLGQLA